MNLGLDELCWILACAHEVGIPRSRAGEDQECQKTPAPKQEHIGRK
jgi:hypothetical protein